MQMGCEWNLPTVHTIDFIQNTKPRAVGSSVALIQTFITALILCTTTSSCSGICVPGSSTLHHDLTAVIFLQLHYWCIIQILHTAGLHNLCEYWHAIYERLVIIINLQISTDSAKPELHAAEKWGDFTLYSVTQSFYRNSYIFKQGPGAVSVCKLYLPSLHNSTFIPRL